MKKDLNSKINQKIFLINKTAYKIAYKNAWHVAKTVFREKCIGLHIYIPLLKHI